jgi:hypothetical protein
VLNPPADPATVYTEIFGLFHVQYQPLSTTEHLPGIIKGSERAVSAAEGYISRDDYFNMSSRSLALEPELRLRIYELFEAYQRILTRRQELDDADR